MRKIAIFGGSFDPPHIGHLIAIRNVLNSKLVDEIWITPAGDERYDKCPVAPAEHRRRMVELMIEHEFKNNPAIKLELLQLTEPGNKGFAVELLDRLKAEHPEDKFYFIIGADNLKTISAWHSAEELVKKYEFIVLMRGNEVPDASEYPPTFHMLIGNRYIAVEISSTQIRYLIKEKERLEGLVSMPVINYILANGLYL